MVLSTSRSKFSVLTQADNLENYTMIVELPKLTVLYRFDLGKFIPIVPHPREWDIFNVLAFRMDNCHISLQRCCGRADVEIEVFCRNLAGDSSQSMGCYPNSQIRLYQIRALNNNEDSIL